MFKKKSSVLAFLLLGSILMILPFGLLIQPVEAVQLQFYEASIELDNSRPGQPSNWIIELKNAQAIPPNGYIRIHPEAGKFTIPAPLSYEDVDLYIGAEISLAAVPGTGAGSAWGVSVVAGTNGEIVLTNNNTDTITADSTIIIEIGNIATAGATGNDLIINPIKSAAVGNADISSVQITSYDASAESIDTIELLIATIEHIDTYAGQKAQMTFEIAGITPPIDGAISPNLIEWREVTPNVLKTAVMRVKVNTSAFYGFTVYVKQDTNMLLAADNSIDIDPIFNGSVGTNDSPVAWISPTGTVIGVNTGFLGYTTSDTSLNNVGDGVDRFNGGTLFSGLTTTSEEVLFHDEASQSNIDGQDYADITFQLEVNSLQASGNYSHEILFIAKPVF